MEYKYGELTKERLDEIVREIYSSRKYQNPLENMTVQQAKAFDEAMKEYVAELDKK